MQRQLTLDVLLTDDERRVALLNDARIGLTATPKSLPPVWFYDQTGSRLFDEITRLPEYYPTRTEAAILRRSADDMATLADADTLVEIGSGTSEKTRMLLNAMAATGTLRRIILLDVSIEVLREAAATLGHEYGVDVHALVGDFRHHLPLIPAGGRRLWAFLGGTIGNVVGRQRSRLLLDLRTSMGPDDHLLLGTDLVKPVERLIAAYDDSAGVTAAFNRNVLTVLNRELGADFDPTTFVHVTRWDPEHEWIEMRLRSQVDQHIDVRALNRAVHFRRGEELLTEISDKFRPTALSDELRAAGLDVDRTYRDERADFQLSLVHPHGPAGRHTPTRG